MAIDPIVSLIVGAFGAAALTLLGALLGAWLQARREHSRWLRDQRFAIYLALLELQRRRPEVESMSVQSEESRQYMKEMARVQGGIALLGPRRMRDAIEAHSVATATFMSAPKHPDQPRQLEVISEAFHEVQKATDALLTAARKELKIHD
jgi:hypothetical protein